MAEEKIRESEAEAEIECSGDALIIADSIRELAEAARSIADAINSCAKVMAGNEVDESGEEVKFTYLDGTSIK